MSRRERQPPDRRIMVQFTALTFGVAYLVSGALIVLGRFGYTTHNAVQTLPQFFQMVPFAVYILSPAIASYVVLRHHDVVAGPRQWLATVFYATNSAPALSSGVIDFWMFAVQLVAFRFLYGAIYRISGRGGVFMCVFAHTVFNAASYAVGIPPTTWAGTLVANAAVVLLAAATVAVHRRSELGRAPR